MKKKILKIALIFAAAMLIVAPASAEKTDSFSVQVTDQTTGTSATSNSGHGNLAYPYQVEEASKGPYPVTCPHEIKEKEPGNVAYPYEVKEANTGPYPVTYPHEIKENVQGTSTGSGGHGSSSYAIRVDDNQASPSITTEVKENAVNTGFRDWFDTSYDHMKRTYYIITVAGFDTDNAREILESMNDYRNRMEDSGDSFDSTYNDSMKEELKMLIEKFYNAIGDSL